MRIQEWALLFCGIFLAGYLAFVVSVDTTATESTMDIRYSDYLTTATYDAMNSVAGEDYCFNTEEKRETASNTFYHTLAYCLDAQIRGEDYVQDMVPFVIYVDYDGYYVQYRDYINTEYDLATCITNLNTWTTASTDGKYLIRFYLGEDIKVTDRVSGTVAEGNRQDVYDLMGQPADLYYLTTDRFYEERDYFVVQGVQNAINYYCNNYNRTNPLGYTYEVTLPSTKGTDEGRLIDEPCIISFLQGAWFGLTGTEADIYAFGGAELTKGEMYYTTVEDGEQYYHREGCSHLISHTVTGQGKMNECARRGAYPCSDCVR